MKIESDRDDVKIKVFVDHQLFGEQVSGGAVPGTAVGPYSCMGCLKVYPTGL